MRKAVTQKRAGQLPAAAAGAGRTRANAAQRESLQSQSGFQNAELANVSLTLNSGMPVLAQRKLVESMQQSPRMIAQRQKSRLIQRKPGGKLLQEKADVAQRVEEDELLQGKFEAVQRVEEEELLQGKFATTQLVEDEELMQGKFETAQLMEEEDLLQGKFATAQLVEDEELMQGKFATAQLKEDSTAPNKTGLPDNLKSGIESLSGMSMDAVKVHYNSDKPSQLNAHAYAQGTDIHVASGQEKHLPHEAWHVVQQAQGRVNPTAQMKGGVQINDDKSLETEADNMGAKAMQLKQSNQSQKSANSGQS